MHLLPYFPGDDILCNCSTLSKPGHLHTQNFGLFWSSLFNNMSYL